jgi:hypothetical protein
MDYVHDYVPSEEELDSEHWSKSPEYLAEKAKAVHPGQGFVSASTVLPASRTKTTHDIMKESFTVEYKKTDEELEAELEAAEKSIREDFDKQAEIYEQLAIDLLNNVEKSLENDNV